MNFIKKIAKEVNVFGLIFVVFVCLLAYKQFTKVELSTLTTTKLEEKLEAKDSFVVLLGSDENDETLSCKELCLAYLKENKSKDIYYVDLTNEKNPTKYIQDTFNSDDGTMPSMIVVEKGKLAKQKSSAFSYYRIAELFN